MNYLSALSSLLIPCDQQLFDFSVQLSAELKGELLAVLSAFCWAGSASVYRKGLQGIDAWSGNFIRTGLAAVGFFVIMAAKGSLSHALSDIDSSIFFWLIFSAFFAFFLGDSLFLFALKKIGVSKTVPLSSTFPLFAVVWSFVIFRRPVSIPVIAGTLLIIFAIKLISEEKEDISSTDSKGVLFALLAAVCWSVSILVLDHLVVLLPSEAVAGFRFLITFVLVGALLSKGKFTYTKHAFLWIGVGGVAILILGNYTFLEAIRMAGSAAVAPISAIYPVISVLLAALFLREKLTRNIVGGTLFSFAGVLIIVLGSAL
ncbi:MAG: DMT family transporter [Theionarchaea archaeon]|nr:DMT family transporter [Theionarchaea archaeon]